MAGDGSIEEVALNSQPPSN
ncbi:uncharacterized protein G2W53_021286 [Senna tora]|uniref:Uncharacterized protein n=1 Tax=Senna tora TaxID=362788 RepID=A0A834TKS9_9FABA|nr:uncharacterized protein G2W53_021286 [Senna tora]